MNAYMFRPEALDADDIKQLLRAEHGKTVRIKRGAWGESIEQPERENAMTYKEHLDAALERLSKAVRELHEVKEGRDRLHRHYSDALGALAEIKGAVIEHLDPYAGETYVDAIKAAGETLERQAERIDAMRVDIDDLQKRNDVQAEMIDAIASERDEAEEELARLKQPDSFVISCPPGMRIAGIRYEPA